MSEKSHLVKVRTPLSYTNFSSEHSSAEVQGAAVTYCVPTGRRHDEGDTLLCSKFRLQINSRTNLQWFGPIFILGGAMMKVVPCYALNFDYKYEIGPN